VPRVTGLEWVRGDEQPPREREHDVAKLGRGRPRFPGTFSADLATPGVLLLTGAERPPAGALAQTYPLAGDPTGAPATYSWAYKQTKTRGLSVGIKAYGRLAQGDGVLWGA
jgi:hypothetical protein